MEEEIGFLVKGRIGHKKISKHNFKNIKEDL